MTSLFLLVLLVIAILQVAFAGQYDGWDVTQVHMAQGKTPESMTISWVTKSAAKTQIFYGTSAHNLAMKAEGYSTSYSFNYPQYGVYQSGVIHHVPIGNLTASTQYFYQVGDFSANFTSGTLTFKTMPEVGNLDTFFFGVIGDLGQTTDSESTINHILNNNNLGLILHAGDLSYADCNQPLWDSYGELIQDLSSQRPWMSGPGNHEIEYNNDGSMFLAFEERYKMPAVKPAEFGKITIPPSIDATGNPYCASSVFQAEYNYGNSFFSFEAASAHVIYLNPYSVTDETSPQYKWLISDLESVDRSKTPWVIVVMHCPFYNSNTAHNNEEQALLMQASMEPVFYKYKVNIVFAGHVHAYERTYPVYQGQNRPDGVVYVTIGDGGNREGHALTYHPQPSWSAYRNGTQYGHGELELQSKDKMIWRWYRNVDGNIVDKDEYVVCNSAFRNARCV